MKTKYKNIAVLGAGESGTGAAILAQKQGCRVFVSDKGQIKDEYKTDLDALDIEWEEGTHSEERILNADCIIKSPGIPDKAELIQKAHAKNIPVISEIEWASYFTNAKCIGITGTNGKTTTSTLTFQILQNAGLNVGLAGNIGKSFARSVAEDNFDYYVLELSSFQLDGLHHFKSYISVLLNITPDHLDRYGYKYENYIESKFRVTMNQGEGEYFIYNQDDPVIMEYLAKHPVNAKLLAISQTGEVFPGSYIEDDQLIIGLKHKKEMTMKFDFNALQGKHNRYNTMAATVVSTILEVRKDVVRESLKRFENVEHRLQPIANINGVEFINDSKATNVNSAWYALESMKKPVIWIAGGIDKGNEYDSMKPIAREKVRALICLGKDNVKLHEEFKDVIDNIMETTSMKEAVRMAASLAGEGYVVLLAPACASFDLFQNYEDRGRQFKNAVLNLQ
jgi:UDP-N-acetylmuramoylalanine--D-glutamate ligase